MGGVAFHFEKQRKGETEMLKRQRAALRNYTPGCWTLQPPLPNGTVFPFDN